MYGNNIVIIVVEARYHGGHRRVDPPLTRLGFLLRAS